MAEHPHPHVPPPSPWWRHGFVWLVLSGPAIVVVASVFTFVLAAADADRLIEEDSHRKGAQLQQRLADRPLLPAVQGRNHAATPDHP
jgi:hypothetical protein